MEYRKYADGKFLMVEDSASEKNLMVSKHYHNVFEIYFLMQGTCRYFIDNKLYTVEAGDLILIPEGTLHKTMYDGGYHARRLINCSAHFIPSGVMDQLSSFFHLYRNPALLPKIRELFDSIHKEFSNPDEFSEDILLGYLHLLFYTLVRGADTCESVQTDNIYTAQAISYIKEHYDREITLTDLAKLTAVSPEHLSRLFKKETGFGFSEYLSMFRLQKAEEMLRSDPHVRICDVAFACGFSDSNYFSDKFKQTYGVSPIKIRNKTVK